MISANNAVTARVAANFAAVEAPSEDYGRSEREILQGAIADIAKTHRKRRNRAT